jgi:hypothetical protein
MQRQDFIPYFINWLAGLGIHSPRQALISTWQRGSLAEVAFASAFASFIGQSGCPRIPARHGENQAECTIAHNQRNILFRNYMPDFRLRPWLQSRVLHPPNNDLPESAGASSRLSVSLFARCPDTKYICYGASISQ